MSEYESYWSWGTSTTWIVESVAQPSVTRLRLGMSEHHLVADPRGRDGLIIPVEAAKLPLPPSGDVLAWVRMHLMPQVRGQNLRLLAKALGPNPERFSRVVFRVPRNNGLDVHLGVKVTAKGSKRHPLRTNSGRAIAERVTAYPWDVQRLKQRGGASLELGAKRVMLVGCGAVGGHVAMELVRAGVGHITLVDPDSLVPENSYRHVLGMVPPTFMMKAIALKLEAEGRYPRGAIVDAICEPVETVLPRIDIGQLDAVVVAVDRPSAAQAVNRASLEAGVPVIHSWLEAMGVGLHVLRAASGTSGCFECLLRDPNNGALVHNRASLAAPGQDFTKDEAGCGGRYVPFGSVHAAKVANLAVAETIDALRKKGEPRLLTWKGDFDAFRESGFHLSERAVRWPSGAQIQEISSTDVAVRSCPVCAQ